MNEETKISETEYVRANQLLLKPTRGHRIFYTIGFISLVAWFFVAPNLILKSSAVGAIAGALAVHTYGRFVYAPRKTKLVYRSSTNEERQYSVALIEDGIKINSSFPELVLAWDEIMKWREDHELLLVFMSKKQYFIFPKRLSNAGDIKKQLQARIGQPIV